MRLRCCNKPLEEYQNTWCFNPWLVRVDSVASFPDPRFVWLHEGKASSNRIKREPGNEAIDNVPV